MKHLQDIKIYFLKKKKQTNEEKQTNKELVEWKKGLRQRLTQVCRSVDDYFELLKLINSDSKRPFFYLFTLYTI